MTADVTKKLCHIACLAESSKGESFVGNSMD